MEKCYFDDVKYHTCEAIEKGIRGTNGHELGLTIMQVHNMNTGEDYNRGLLYRWSRKKEDVVFMNFCPACGADITPK